MTTQTILIGELPVEVQTEARPTVPPSLVITATYETISITSVFTVGPNNPETPLTAEDLQAAVDAFRNDLATKVASQFNLTQLVAQLT